MQASEILLLQQTTIAAEKANRLDTPMPAIILQKSDGQQVVSLESFELGRTRFRGALATTSLDDFVAYVKSIGDAAGFVDVESMTSKVFFNLGDRSDPGHADWHASLSLKPTAAFNALAKIDGQKLAQKDLAEWLEDWNDFVAPQYADGTAAPTLARAIAAIRKLTINASSQSVTTVTNTSASRSAMEDIEAQSGNDLPTGFSFVCEPYLGLKSRSFRLVISVLTGEDKPKLVLRWQQREATIESIAQEFKQVLATNLGESSSLTIGTFKA